ncbi:MAG: DUF481 domain-containing protein [Myxococcales bacterium]|nr:DUF481 domain-containing protein [Myxococcales bacterium]
MTPSIAALATLAVHLGAAQLEAAAEPEDPAVPAGTVTAAPASSGTTELEGQGKFATTDAEARAAEDATELDISAGGLLSTGNAFAAAATGQARFRLRRGIHQAGAEAAVNYGRADVSLLDDDGVPAGSERQTTINNVQGRVRYDVFFARRWSAFGMVTLRRDVFQGLALRTNVDPGVSFHALVDNPKHRLAFELGYDFQYDIRCETATREALPGEEVDPGRCRYPVGADQPDLEDRTRVADDTLINHAARIAAGYSNSLSERVTVSTDVEYLQSVLVGRRFRLNWFSAVTTQLANRLGMSVTFTLRYENEPLPDVAKLDTITAVLLTLRFI